MVGLVFFAKSPRFVGLDHARELAARARDRARIVALTVDADDDLLAAIASVVGPDMLQLHGRETPQRVAAIKQAFGLPAMKAIGVSEAADFIRARDYESVADWLLIDAKPPKDAVLPGGNGRPFDWRLARGFAPRVPVAALRRARRRQRRRGGRAVGRARRRRLLRRRTRARRQGREQNCGLRRRRARRLRAPRRGKEPRVTKVDKPNSFRNGPDERGHFGVSAAASSPRR